MRATMDLPLTEAATRLGRTGSAVSQRRLRIRGTVRPQVVGFPTPPRGRPDWLVAKTCPKCGLFLGAEHFPSRWRGGRTHKCAECSVAVSHGYGRRDWEATRPAADHHYQLWTDREHDVVMEVDARGRWVRTAREAAAMIGRTAGAVQKARSVFRKAETGP